MHPEIDRYQFLVQKSPDDLDEYKCMNNVIYRDNFKKSDKIFLHQMTHCRMQKGIVLFPKIFFGIFYVYYAYNSYDKSTSKLSM